VFCAACQCWFTILQEMFSFLFASFVLVSSHDFVVLHVQHLILQCVPLTSVIVALVAIYRLKA